MKKYICPQCQTTAYVIKYGYRQRTHRFFCKKCGKHFSVNPCFSNHKAILNDHLDGISFRKLAAKYHLSPMTVWRICKDELRQLPDNNQFTFKYCSRFSRVFVFDGKYFNVASQTYDWVLLWGVDYFRHDIPIILVAPSENYQAWSKFFFYFRIINSYPDLMVCDDNTNLKLAARRCFPAVKIQTCFNHFKENIRRNLKVRSEETHRDFMVKLEKVLSGKLCDEELNKRMFNLYHEYRHDPVATATVLHIEKCRSELTGYRGVPGSPVTSNMIEGLNSHLEARLQSLRSFQTVSYAKLWLNGYVLKRRFTAFTDCRGKFRHLNGKKGVEMTKKPKIDLPSYF